MPITEKQMSLSSMKKKGKSHKCGVCGAMLNVAWGGSVGINGYILRCGVDIKHDTVTDYKKPSTEYEEGNKLFRRLQGMDTKALMKMDTATMLARIGQAKFPKDLTKQEIALMSEVSISYGLDPLMQELMIYQGNPYPTINARYRKAQETGKFDGINTSPATEEECKARHAKEGDYLYRAEVWVKGASHPFVGWGRVRAAETIGNPHLPIVKDPDRQAEKRAEAMGLRKAFSMPVPFQSWEEFQEQRAESAIDVEYRVIDKKTGEITETEPIKGAPERIQVDAEETIPEETETEPESETPPARDTYKDETPITPQQLNELDAMMSKTCTNLTSLGKFMNKDKGWNVKKLGDLKCWQFNEIMAAYQKGQEQPPAEKLL